MFDDKSFINQFRLFNSKKVALEIVNLVLEDPNRMQELMDCFFHKEMRICQRASWSVGLMANHKPELLHPYLEKMLLNLDTPHHDAVLRNTFRTFQYVDFPEEIEGLAFEKAFDFFLDINYAVAIRVFAMTVCGNIAQKYPELSHELIPTIEEHIPHGSAGFRARGMKLLKVLRKNT